MEAGALEVQEHPELCETDGVGGGSEGREGRREGVREREREQLREGVCWEDLCKYYTILL